MAIPKNRGHAQRKTIGGPRFRMGAICDRVYNGDEAAARALACHAYGDEMPSPCATCKGKDGPFDAGDCVSGERTMTTTLTKSMTTSHRMLGLGSDAPEPAAVEGVPPQNDQGDKLQTDQLTRQGRRR
ncbi:hypothetical protein DL767_010168 [Monosporascus sp. MG133]|nr:hypothetical protein DL767_010168 [Monosporascus sp. MG133]